MRPFCATCCREPESRLPPPGRRGRRAHACAHRGQSDFSQPIGRRRRAAERFARPLKRLPRYSKVPRLSDWYVTQPDHGRISAELAAAFDSRKVPRLDEAVVRAIAMHDMGWMPYDGDITAPHAPSKLESGVARVICQHRAGDLFAGVDGFDPGGAEHRAAGRIDRERALCAAHPSLSGQRQRDAGAARAGGGVSAARGGAGGAPAAAGRRCRWRRSRR